MLRKITLSIALIVPLILISCGKDTETIVQVRYAPVLFDLSAPDSLQQGSLQIIHIYISAYDPDGNDDVDSVYFISTRPDGSSSGTHLYLADDGATYDDSVAGDGRYTIGIQPPDTSSQTGDYTFKFYALDMLENRSNNPQKIVTVY